MPVVGKSWLGHEISHVTMAFAGLESLLLANEHARACAPEAVDAFRVVGIWALLEVLGSMVTRPWTSKTMNKTCQRSHYEEVTVNLM